MANAVQQYLQDNGATDIPSDPTRLYDTWQEHAYAQTNADGGAIWKVTIQGDDYELNLTVMVFEADRLFKVGHTPADMKGHITVLSQDTNIKNLSQPSNSEIEQKPETEPLHEDKADSETVKPPSVQTQSADPFDVSNEQSIETSNKPTQIAGTNSDGLYEIGPEPGELITPSAQGSGAVPSSVAEHENTGAVSNDKKLAQNELDQSSNSGVVPIDLKSIPKPSDPDIGEYFLQWVKRSVRERKLKVNQAKAQVHIIADGVILISPSIIKKFCLKMDFDVLTGKQPTWKMVQANFHKLKQHIKTDNHVNIHKFQVKGEHRTSLLNGYLLPFDVIYPDGKHPGINKLITHLG